MIRSTLALVVLAACAAPSVRAQVTVDWSTVGNAGNAGDPENFGQGAVAFEYRIGTFEVTNAQYAEFLNTVAASDPRGLYNASMGSDPRGGITRSGIDGSFTYTVRPNMGNKPVNFVSFFDAARMANWLTNNQGSGSTESGAYTFSGEGIGAVTAITRDLSNPNQVFIPTSNEWFKAAYHQPASRGGDTDNFWRFATQSNIVPILAIATPTGDIANPGPNVVNYDFGSDWNEQNGNVTTVGSAGNTSFYGAFDMSGNVWEWNEDSFFAGDNLQRGGSFTNIAQFGIGSDFWSSGPPAVEQVNSGFRFASPALPPPCIADFNNDGSLDFFDVSGFLGAFNVQSHQADIAAPFGVLNFFDVAAYIGFFGQGCP